MASGRTLSAAPTKSLQLPLMVASPQQMTVLLLPPDNGEPAISRVPVVLREQRQPPVPCAELQAWVLGVDAAFVALFALACLHLIRSPLPVLGGRAEAIPLWLWGAALTVVVAMKLYARLSGIVCWRCRGAKCGFLFWVALSIAVLLPGVPVMSWVFAPGLALAEAIIYVRACTHSDEC